MVLLIGARGTGYMHPALFVLVIFGLVQVKKMDKAITIHFQPNGTHLFVKCYVHELAAGVIINFIPDDAVSASCTPPIPKLIPGECLTAYGSVSQDIATNITTFIIPFDKENELYGLYTCSYGTNLDSVTSEFPQKTSKSSYHKCAWVLWGVTFVACIFNC